MTTPTEALRSPQVRKRLIWFVLLAVAVLLLLRFAVLAPNQYRFLPNYFDLLARTLESFSVALLTGLAIPVLAIWLGPDSEELAKVQILDRKLETTPAFEAAFQTTSKWWFRGGMGSYFRSSTLPALLKHRPPVEVMLVLLDIRDQKLIDRYAAYRQAQGNPAATATEIRKNIICSIWALVMTKPGLGTITSASVHLTDVYSSFRIDLSSDWVFLTQDAPEAPALRFSSQSSYYKGFENEFRQSWALTVRLHDQIDHIDFESPEVFFEQFFQTELSEAEIAALKAL
ncbi:hypothetical protein [Luteimonas kalidii]|uniref:Uncharacterized protein n=1 Tax=Luteimonas kalidii TaxID=3042025 RepID=A0ABT6JUS4_9GAMM|nr:hypothetical protein [Luteimonas kalidii]MDH5834225.1 hypothetical protein [Luteimonas kalidii]